MNAARAIEWRRAISARVADDIRPWQHGTVVRATDFPTYYQYNLIRVEGPDAGLGVADLTAAADRELEGLAHRRVELEDLAAGERVRDGFRGLGWMVERLAFLERELPAPEREAPGGTVIELDGFEASRPLRAAWQGESLWGDPPEFFVVEEAAAARVGTRCVIGYADGAPAGFAAYAVHGDTMEVELVFCMPARRNGGLGGALVSRALAAGAAEGARHALIEADDDGDSKRLYERLGFRTTWTRYTFTRKPDASAAQR
jgi:GNAT superfamily N-acetyltransferase